MLLMLVNFFVKVIQVVMLLSDKENIHPLSCPALCYSVGILTQFLDEVVGNQRVVEVDFPENPQWRCLFYELRSAAPEKLKVRLLCKTSLLIAE